jgi:DNA-directed RNA polymerase beta subunit
MPGEGVTALPLFRRDLRILLSSIFGEKNPLGFAIFGQLLGSFSRRQFLGRGESVSKNKCLQNNCQKNNCRVIAEQLSTEQLLTNQLTTEQLSTEQLSQILNSLNFYSRHV